MNEIRSLTLYYFLFRSMVIPHQGQVKLNSCDTLHQ